MNDIFNDYVDELLDAHKKGRIKLNSLNINFDDLCMDIQMSFVPKKPLEFISFTFVKDDIPQ